MPGCNHHHVGKLILSEKEPAGFLEEEKKRYEDDGRNFNC